MNNNEPHNSTQWETPPPKEKSYPPNSLALILNSTYLILIAVAVIATIMDQVCRKNIKSQLSPSLEQNQEQQKLPSQTDATVTTQDNRESEEAHFVHMETPRIQKSEEPVMISIRSNRWQEM